MRKDMEGMRKEVINPGDGKTAPKAGDTLSMHYVGKLAQKFGGANLTSLFRSRFGTRFGTRFGSCWLILLAGVLAHLWLTFSLACWLTSWITLWLTLDPFDFVITFGSRFG